MAIRRGISILDLLPQTTGPAGFAPDDIVERIGVLTVLEHRSTQSPNYFLHDGTLQSVADALDVDTNDWGVRVPGLTHGLPFRLAVARGAAGGAAGQEAAPGAWSLDIQVSDVEVLLPGVRAAHQTGGSGAVPLTLEPNGGSDVAQRVYLVARGVLRISGGPGGTQVQVVDTPDPLDPTAPTGAVIRTTARPPHFLFGGSRFGMTLQDFVIDLSPTFSPAEVVSRGHDETWRGVSFREATLYLPPNTPIVHSLSVSARDVIVGQPGGLQGELRLEFGEDVATQFNKHLTVFRWTGQADTPVNEDGPVSQAPIARYSVPLDAGGQTQRVRAQFEIATNLIGQTGMRVVGVWWRLPDGKEGNAETTPYFEAPTAGTLRYRLRVGPPEVAGATAKRPGDIPDGQTELAEVTVSFPRGNAPAGNPPVVDADIGGVTYRNVVHLRGPRELLAGIAVHARGPDVATTRWTLGTGAVPLGATGADFTLPRLTAGIATSDLVLQHATGLRRVRIDVVRAGPLVVGHAETMADDSPAVVTVVGAGDATPTRVLDTFAARAFHDRGQRPGVGGAAKIVGKEVTVPAGSIAEVEVPVPAGVGAALPAPVTPATVDYAAVQMLFAFDGVTPQNVVFPLGEQDAATPHAGDTDHEAAAVAIGRPRTRAALPGDDARAQLAWWLQSIPFPSANRRYYVIARTDDIKFAGDGTENDAYNAQLAGDRLKAAVAALKAAAGAAPIVIVERIETAAWPNNPPPNGVPARFTLPPSRLALPAAMRTQPPGATRPVWNDRWTDDGPTSAQHFAARDDARRFGYRCAEILAVDVTAPPPQPPAPPPVSKPVPTNIFVPGKDGAAPDAGGTSTAEQPVDYRVRLRAKWDSPTLVTPADAIPTEAEALVAFKSDKVELPATNSGKATKPLPAPSNADFWEILLHWTYDARTSQTEMSGALTLPDGALQIDSDFLAGALAFGPAITAMVDPSDAASSPLGAFIGAAAILAVGGAIGELLNSAEGATPSTVEIDKVAIAYRWNGASQVSATVDYTIDLRIAVVISGAVSLTGKVRLRYKGVGLRFDFQDKGGLSGLALTYDDLSVEVADPGTWSLGGPLGNLIRVASSRIGNGSQWMEFDLEFALDLGVVRLEGATIRLTLDPFRAELRGLTARVSIESVLEGKGSLTVGDGGAIRALLGLQIIPAKLGAYGALAVDKDFVAIEVGVQLPVGLPLGATGFGLFGLMGRFVANGTRDVNTSDPDVVARELAWYAKSPETKYKRKSGQFALGLGAVIGTLPDGGFSFNAEGSLTVGFPDVSVVFGIDAKLAAERKMSATEGGTGSDGQSFRMLGLTVIDEEAVMVAIRATWLIPKVLQLDIPFSAYFPLQNSKAAWYIRLGSDGYPGAGTHPARPGNPISLTLFPSILDVKAWAFLMMEERELFGLGGIHAALHLSDPLDFSGFSLGIGAGFDLSWSAGPFSLSISAFMLVGLGTKPLLVAAAVGVTGELDLVVLSVSVDGFVHAHVSPDYKYIEGHFCGHVDCLLFEVEGCIDIRIGDDPPNDIPEPASPLIGVDLCDHMAAVKASASKSATGNLPTVWPDTVAVLKFTHYVDDGMGTTCDFVRKVASPAALSPWSGSTELKYAFRVTDVSVFRLTGGDPTNDASWSEVTGPFDSAWWLPTHRRAIVSGTDEETGPSTEEGRELGLFHWDPRAWSRWLGEGSADLPGDPANSIDVVCDPPPPLVPSCAFGVNAQAAFQVLARFDASPKPKAVFPSVFRVRAKLGAGLSPSVVAQIAGDMGWQYVAGDVAMLHGSVVAGGEMLTKGWRLPALRVANQMVTTLPTMLRFSKPLRDGDLVLEACIDRTAPSTAPVEVCDAIPKGEGAIASFVGMSGTTYSGAGLQLTALAGRPALLVDTGKLRGDYPKQAARVRVDVQPRGGVVKLTALGDGGVVIAQAKTTGVARQSLVLNDTTVSHIRAIIIEGEGGKPLVFGACWLAADTNPLKSLVDAAESDKPRITLYDADGKSIVITPTVFQPAPVNGLVVLPTSCTKHLFHLPLGTRAAGGGGWVSAEVHGWRRGDVTFVSLCAITVEAARAQAQNEAVKDSIQTLLNELAQNVESNDPTHAVYLDRNTTYQLRVTWQYQGFRPNDPGDEPGTPSAVQWLDAKNGKNVDRWTFRTADFGTVALPAPAQTSSIESDPAQGGPGYDERTFDPRGIARFITRAAPNVEDPPHFLDDHMGFWFMADHLEPLVEKYDRVLRAQVLHTRPAPGSMHDPALSYIGDKYVLDVTMDAGPIEIDTLTWFEPDKRFSDKADELPCIVGKPALGSSSLSVTALLEPESEYDLLLTVAPPDITAPGAPPSVTVARNHFRTSRYRNPTELLRGLGFATPMAYQPPIDAIATATLGGPNTLTIGDAALDAALGTLGMDPWPLPAGPRTTAIWQRPASAGQPWRLIGVLLEADEPIWRAGFRTGAVGEVEPPPRVDVNALTLRRHYEQNGSQTVASLGALTPRVRNAAGTRILLAAAAPIVVQSGLTYDLQLTFNENGVAGATGTMPLYDRPLVVFQEGE